jgi:hypothetical protein
MRAPGEPLNLEQAGRALNGGGNKAAGLASIGQSFIQSMMDARRKSQEEHEAALSRFTPPSPPPKQRPSQHPLLQFSGQRLGSSGFFGSRGGY